LISPAQLVNLLNPLKATIEDAVKSNELIVSLVSGYFGPLIVNTINFGIIPTLVHISSTYECYWKKSSQERSIMGRIYFFMLLNTLVIPLTLNETIVATFKEFKDEDILYWPRMLSVNLMAQQYYFLGVIIMLTFISNGLWLIDSVHRSWVFVMK